MGEDGKIVWDEGNGAGKGGGGRDREAGEPRKRGAQLGLDGVALRLGTKRERDGPDTTALSPSSRSQAILN